MQTMADVSSRRSPDACVGDSMELTVGSKPTPNEAAFLRMVENGDTEQVKQILQHGEVNVNVIGFRKRRPVTALQLAAAKNDFRMVKLLLENGAQSLDLPSIPDGEEDVFDDTTRCNLCSALSSPAYLSLAHRDPLDEAVEFTQTLRALADCREIADTSKKQYVEVAERVKEYAVDLLSCCDTSREVLTLLNGRNDILGDVRVRQFQWNGQQNGLKLLRKAVDADYKEFVAHQKCQKVMKKLWLQGQPEWHTRNGVRWTILYGLYFLLVYLLALPLLCLAYIVAPYSPVYKLLDTPKAKFLSHASSYFIFLSFILVEDIVLHTDPHEDLHTVNEVILFCLLFYFLAFAWLEVVQLYTLGARAYFYDIKNMIDIFCLATFITGSVVHLIDEFGSVDIYLKLVCDTAMSVALVFAFLRFLRFLYLSQFLGPLLILMVAMKHDVTRFFVIYVYAVGSFTFGFYYLYYEIVDSGDFSSFGKIIESLVTVVFGSDPSSSLSVSVSVNTTSGEVHDVSLVFEVIGVTLYVLFGTVIIIVLLNISIAMMSDTYGRLKRNIDMEWKFIRTQMWLEYMDSPVLPPPFNIIVPSVPCFMFIHDKISRRKISSRVNQGKQENELYDGKESSVFKTCTHEYDKLMRALLHRYTVEKGIVTDDSDEALFDNGNDTIVMSSEPVEQKFDVTIGNKDEILVKSLNDGITR
ncbi:short transient receptor potential channel 3-like [Ptychodera flava]|uniref:short transient receptor potential channel 3-like n=1 Tax=Ptychodera flava TaxID=63121 RepID=UPI00396A3DBE